MNLSGLATLGLATGSRSGSDPREGNTLNYERPLGLATNETIATSSAMQANDNLRLDPRTFELASGSNLSGPNSMGELVALANSAAAGQQQALKLQLLQQQQQLQQQRLEQQQSFADWWQEYWSRQPFPSGYTQSSITLVACLLTTFIFLIVVGNLLVCIAIFTEKSLKPTQNWFIASLAVSDMLLGLVVMPFSLARELMGFWVFGPLWCDIHEALDVLLTTASINTLCLISLDRYWSITQAVNYLKKRTPRRAVLMIAFVWVFSAAVSLPPLIGWKKQSPSVTAPLAGPALNGTTQQRPPSMPVPPKPAAEGATSDASQPDESMMEADGETPPGEPEQQRRDRRRKRHGHDKSALVPSSEPRHRDDQPQLSPLSIPALIAGTSGRQQQTVINYAYLSSASAGEQQLELLLQQQQQQQQLATEYPTCQLSDDIGYVLYSALGSFYIPCAVMVFTYIKIGLAARKRARRAINKQARAQAAGDKAKRAGAGANNARGRTITGTTSGRSSKQLPTGDSTLLLTPSAINETAGHRCSSAAMLANRRRNSRPQSKLSGLQQGESADERRESLGPLVVGKPVVVERQRGLAAGAGATQQQTSDQMQVTTSMAVAAQGGTQTAAVRCAATLTTSGSKLASPSALKYSGECGSTRAAADPPEAQVGTEEKAEGRRKPAKESNDSSLITVISASMQELPQVTRFNFAPGQQPAVFSERLGADRKDSKPEQQDKAEALLRVISQAADHQDDDQDEATRVELGHERATPTNKLEKELECEREQQLSNNSTNETCFMTIEEDSDHLDSQTGRTIMMIASNAKQSSSSLAGKSRLGMTMTMMPAATATATAPGGQQPNDSSLVCNNVVCLRRQARRRARRLRHDPSYCGSSSLTINDEDEDEAEDEEDDGDEEDEGEEEDEEEDDLLANSIDSGGDEHENCPEDEFELTDECNGYSGGSCRAYCTATVSSTCEQCRDCAALSTGTQAASSGECLEDSPLSCEAYNYLKCTPPESPIIANARNSTRLGKCQLEQPHRRRATGSRRNQTFCQHNHSPLAVRHQRSQHQQQPQHLSCNMSEIEAQSLTGDDNLSLTDICRSNEDVSSIVGHDVLDATPARERLGPKRKSIVAAAIATVGGGLNRMASAATMQHHNHQEQSDEAAAAEAQTATHSTAGRKKSSIGFHFGRFASGIGGSGQAETGDNQSSAGGGVLLALAAASQQQQQQLLVGGGNTTRNLKTLRQNFFHRLNQLTAKSALKQANAGKRGQSSAPSSYGSSFEPSGDYATTSNMHSTNDQYQVEAEMGDYEQRNSAETTRQSSEPVSSGPILLDDDLRDKQPSSADTATCAGHQAGDVANQPNQTSGQSVIISNNVQDRTNLTADDQEDADASNMSQHSGAVPGLAARVVEREGQLLSVNDETVTARISSSGDAMRPAVRHGKTRPGQLKRRSTDKNDTTSVALVCADQRSEPGQKVSGINAISRHGTTGGANSSEGGSSHVIGKAFLASDNERHKRKLAKARERRATLILGLIMATFVSCWFPFFSFYVLRAVCHVCRDYIPPRLEAFIFWMGYCNSACNPIIYTIFNRDFRKAFRKILFRCSRD